MTATITTFTNRREIDECVAREVELTVIRSSDASFDVTLRHATSGVIALRLWTSRKGRVDVVLDCADATDIELKHAGDGSLAQLCTHCRELHLEHLSRGGYALSFTTAGGMDVLMSFSTRGYLRCAAADPAQNTQKHT